MTCVKDNWQAEVEEVAQGIRCRIMERTVRNNGGYLSQACSADEILAVMYIRIKQYGL